jgi:ATP-dependent RNA helicase DeaD
MRGYSAQAIHGDVTQPGRERALKAFRDGRIDVLIATDVAARGLDVPDVSLVVNFDIPPDPEYYVHRIGRTGRSGKAGEAITFVNPREMRELKMIERATGAHIRRGELPTQGEAEERADQQLETRVREVLNGSAWKRYIEVVDSLSSEHDAGEIAAAALALAGERGGHRRLYSRSEPTHASVVSETPKARADLQPARPRPVHAHSKHQTNKRYGKPHKPSAARNKGGYKAGS